MSEGSFSKLPIFSCKSPNLDFYSDAMVVENFTDLTECSFDQFVAFLFDHAAPVGDTSFAALSKRGETDKWHPWYYDALVSFDPVRLCRLYSQLFQEPRFLLERFSRAQLDQGFWAVQSTTLECSAWSLIWNDAVPFATREECVRSMYFLFRELFKDEPLEESVSMWWDSFCYEWHCGNRQRSRGGEDLAMQEVMFETLSWILSLDSDICQGAALHGLSHLHHPQTGALIQNYLSKHLSLPEEWKKVARAAARFELM
jgi:hypothetical protein